MKPLFILFLVSSCSLINKYPDNPIEEGIEDLIEDYTGAKVDITGSTIEK